MTHCFGHISSSPTFYQHSIAPTPPPPPSLPPCRGNPLSWFGGQRCSELPITDERRRTLPGVVLRSAAQPEAVLLRLLQTANFTANAWTGERTREREKPAVMSLVTNRCVCMCVCVLLQKEFARVIQSSGVLVVLSQAWIEELYHQVLERNLLGDAGHWSSAEEHTLPLITMLTGTQ